MIALGNNAHLFAHPYRREQLRSCLADLFDCTVADVEHPGIPGGILVVRFPGGGSLSIEFHDDAPDDDGPRLGTWIELRTDDPAGLAQKASAAGLPEVHHGGHPHYLAIPGGQVFAVAPAG
ncbi:MAG: hypothetical protein ACRDZ8_10460 [Acidimicrobiales bacterium]